MTAHPSHPSPRRTLLAAATALLGVLGSGALIAAAFSPDRTPAPQPQGSASVTPSAPRPTADAPAVGTDPAAAPIADLADPAWVARIAQAGNIPERALAAYAGASFAVARTHPGCGLGWNTLAGIGHVESEHGTINGSSLGPDGVASPDIVGVPLTGQGTAAIRDTDGGILDGDATWDRAVGPMQFIPQTWAQFARDGNGDGVTDVQQIDDAALAAAEYLCSSGTDLTQPANWIAAVQAYNPSVEYNNRVADAANHYATLR
ncbi:MAG: lytic murein transglycosylase [Propioniciclava sp.]|uniref:lytic transglycosylase domain-containing protein n=1 Tax=Propioniciclava sp. TaxID=2038686 RepID=UPI0039E484B5